MKIATDLSDLVLYALEKWQLPRDLRAKRQLDALVAVARLAEREQIARVAVVFNPLVKPKYIKQCTKLVAAIEVLHKVSKESK